MRPDTVITPFPIRPTLPAAVMGLGGSAAETLKTIAHEAREGKVSMLDTTQQSHCDSLPVSQP